MTDESPTLKRMKANGFFLVGCILYVPIVFWDKASGGVDITNRLHLILLIVAASCFLCNGVMEMRTAMLLHESKKEKILDVINGGLFTVAAIFELIWACTWKKMGISLSISTHFYVANAILTLWIRRKADLSIMAARLVAFGDILFLLGSSLDTTGTYLEMKSPDRDLSSFWITSTFCWLADALLYLAADKLYLDHEEAAGSTQDKLGGGHAYESELPASNLSKVV